MIIERTFNIDEIESVAFNPAILNEVLESNCSIDDCDLNEVRDCFLAVRLGGVLIGIYIIKSITKTVLDLHPMILKEHRKYGLESLRLVLKWIVDNCAKSIQKITAQFPSTRKEIGLFALKAGFKKEGVNRCSFLEGEKLVDQVMVGITKEEIKEVLL